ncbi:MAG: integrase arm-type DNA-binding domain-containing protein [Psychromonas sp.]|nr:integrase arm-type DNA-binding domain-containing protein [Psychromonas sp.]
MGIKVTPLTEKQINTTLIKDKDYVLSDGGGLQLRVRTSGSKQWNFNYRHPQTKKRINIGLGIYPSISLIDARLKACQVQDLLTKGIDPKEDRYQKLKHENELLKNANLPIKMPASLNEILTKLSQLEIDIANLDKYSETIKKEIVELRSQICQLQ